ncbi:MAG: c-type cytochrome [Chloroflexota bacterium]|nr:c-type cytochrome [Chloroflexota bacterium]
MKLFKLFVAALTLVLTTIGIFATAYAQGGDAAHGAQLFAQNCAVCHGDRAQGRVGATLAKDFPGIRVDSLLKEIISNGVQGSVMPAWSKAKGGPMSDADVDDLVAFIRSLGHQAPTVPPGPTATNPPLPPTAVKFPPGDLTRGALVFSQNCVVCHGEKGEGRIGATLQKDWPGINVESFLDATIARGVAGSKMPAWAKSNGGPLSDQEIADVAAYVRTFKPGLQPTVAPSSVPQGAPFGGTLALVCGVLLVIVGVVVLAVFLAGSRSKDAEKPR